MTPRRHLTAAPKYLRTTPATGSAAKVERAGGQQGAGLIRDVAVITRGEARGHDAWIDRAMVCATKQHINATPAGIKSRFTHPGLSSDGLGTYLGRLTNARVDQDVTRADLHISQSAHATPDGDLASYVMDLAAEDPAAFGLSIVFLPDVDAEGRHHADHTDEEGEFQSPDPDNARHLPHVRLAELRAADVVDEPAANPAGLFHRDDIAQEADALACYALGLTAEWPHATAFDVHPDRLAAYVAKFLARYGLAITKKKDDPMTHAPAADPLEPPTPAPAADPPADPLPAAPTTTDAPDPVPAPKPKADPAADPPPAADPLEPPTPAPAADPPTDPLAAGRAECAQYIAAFGPRGAEWFAAGRPLADCYQLALAEATAENARLRAAFQQVRGFAAPVSCQPETPPSAGQPNPRRKKLQQAVGDRLGDYAAGLKPPTH